MRGYLGLTRRNLAVYFKDIHAVIFSLLTSIIVFVLYLVFLKATYVDSISSCAVGLENYISSEDIEMLVKGILLVGIIGSALITVPFSCLNTVIKDREQRIDYDISSTPLKRWQIILSYFTASTISAFVISAAILTIALMAVGGAGDMCISSENVAKAYGILLLGSLSATALFMILALLFKTSASASAFFGILSAASGFVIGAYIPLADFSESVQTVCNLFPATQITVLFRNVMLNGLLENFNEKLNGVDNGMFVDAMRESFNLEPLLFGDPITSSQSLIFILAAFAICVVAMTATYLRTYKRK